MNFKKVSVVALSGTLWMGAVLPGVSHAATPNNNVLNVKSEEKVYQSSFANSESLEGFEILVFRWDVWRTKRAII